MTDLQAVKRLENHPDQLTPSFGMVSSLFHSRGPYTLAARLQGHSEGIYSLAISPKGDLLASGGRCACAIPCCDSTIFHQGEDGIRIWDLKTYAQVTWLSRSRSYHGPVTCVAWTTCKDSSSNTLAYGTGLGHLGISRQMASVRYSSKCL
jgi:WD40 repeat protein